MNVREARESRLRQKTSVAFGSARAPSYAAPIRANRGDGHSGDNCQNNSDDDALPLAPDSASRCAASHANAAHWEEKSGCGAAAQRKPPSILLHDRAHAAAQRAIARPLAPAQARQAKRQARRHF
jgi:hypothetical protein